MCGIAGFCLNPKHQSKVNQVELTAQMLLDIEHRGQHATGVAWINPTTGKRAITKAPVAASKFITTKAARNACLNASAGPDYLEPCDCLNTTRFQILLAYAFV